MKQLRPSAKWNTIVQCRYQSFVSWLLKNAVNNTIKYWYNGQLSAALGKIISGKQQRQDVRRERTIWMYYEVAHCGIGKSLQTYFSVTRFSVAIDRCCLKWINQQQFSSDTETNRSINLKTQSICIHIHIWKVTQQVLLN